MNAKHQAISRILIFIDWYKPGYKAGGPIQSVSNLVSQLADQHEFFIVTRNTDYLETNPYSDLAYNSWVELDNCQVCYLDESHQNKSFIRALMLEIKPDIVYCNSLYSPKYTLLPLRLAKELNIQSILAVRGMLSAGSLSVKSTKKKLFLAFIKTIGLFKHVVFHATSEAEVEDIKTHFGSNRQVVLAQNLPAKIKTSRMPKSKEDNCLKLVFLGRIAPEKNTLFAIEQLRECKAQLSLDIYGPVYDENYYQQCLQGINQLPNQIVVKYKGALNPSEIDKILPSYHVLYSPSTGENFGHSIVEGMQYGCIPVISDRTPWRNLIEKQVGFDLSLEKPDSFGNTLDKLAKMSEAEINVLSSNAYNFAKEIAQNVQAIDEYKKLFQLRN